MQGLIGKKLGMTQVYDGEGRRVAVTVIGAGPCRVVQRKTAATDGYEAVQLGSEVTLASRLPKAERVRCEKAGTPPLRVLREFTAAAGETTKAGDTLTVALFQPGEYVDITGLTKGRGFAGVVRRFRMQGGPLTHGGHSKRRIGSIGMRSFPGRVHKNKRMPGHMGHVRMTQQNLRIVQVRPEDNVLLVHGAVPGPTGGLLLVRKAVKRPGNAA